MVSCKKISPLLNIETSKEKMSSSFFHNPYLHNYSSKQKTLLTIFFGINSSESSKIHSSELNWLLVSGTQTEWIQYDPINFDNEANILYQAVTSEKRTSE